MKMVLRVPAVSILAFGFAGLMLCSAPEPAIGEEIPLTYSNQTRKYENLPYVDVKPILRHEGMFEGIYLDYELLYKRAGLSFSQETDANITTVNLSVSDLLFADFYYDPANELLLRALEEAQEGDYSVGLSFPAPDYVADRAAAVIVDDGADSYVVDLADWSSPNNVDGDLTLYFDIARSSDGWVYPLYNWDYRLCWLDADGERIGLSIVNVVRDPKNGSGGNIVTNPDGSTTETVTYREVSPEGTVSTITTEKTTGIPDGSSKTVKRVVEEHIAQYPSDLKTKKNVTTTTVDAMGNVATSETEERVNELGCKALFNIDEQGNVYPVEGIVTAESVKNNILKGWQIILPIDPVSYQNELGTIDLKYEGSALADSAAVTIPVKADNLNYFVVETRDANGHWEVVQKCGVNEKGISIRVADDVAMSVVCRFPSFNDVSGNDWFYNSVVPFACSRQLISGVDMPDGTKQFQGYGLTSRAMFVTMLCRMEGSPIPSFSGGFVDVPKDAWYAQSSQWGQESGLIAGYDDGTFRGENPVTREEITVFLARYASMLGLDVSDRAEINYVDAGDVSEFAKEAMSWAVAKGLILGEGNTGYLYPQRGATRAEAVTMIARFINNCICA